MRKNNGKFVKKLGFMEEKMIIENFKFVNDHRAIGKWIFHDLLLGDLDNIFINEPKVFIDKGFKEVYFLPNGKPYWVFEGWTKGILYTHDGGDEPVYANPYIIKEFEANLYMLIELTCEESIDGLRYINVLKKVSEKEFSLYEIGNRDDINLSFVVDENIVGKWKSIDFVQSINDFNPCNIKKEVLWLSGIDFISDGTVARTYDDETWFDKWTMGKLLDHRSHVISNYELKTINNKEYLFLEWKMGNYVYNGEKPSYYVFEKNSDCGNFI